MRYFLTILLSTIPFACAQSSVREQYNSIYADRSEQSAFEHAPNAFLVQVASTLKPGRALDVGMGQGRNSIYLAQWGWSVKGIDVSDAGVKLAREQAAKLGLKIDAVVADATTYEFGDAQWDLIVFCYVPLNHLQDRVVRALRPGGIVLVEDFHRDTAKFRLLPAGFGDNELLTAFPGARVLRYEDVIARQDWGAQLRDPNRIVRLVAQKPKPAEPGCTWESMSYANGGTVCWGALQLACGPNGWTCSGSCPP